MARIIAWAVLVATWASACSAQQGSPPAPLAANWTGLTWPKGWSTFPRINKPSFDYSEALHKAFIYLRIQRSGTITPAPGQHIAWRSDSCATCKVNRS